MDVAQISTVKEFIAAYEAAYPESHFFSKGWLLATGESEDGMTLGRIKGYPREVIGIICYSRFHPQHMDKDVWEVAHLFDGKTLKYFNTYSYPLLVGDSELEEFLNGTEDVR